MSQLQTSIVLSVFVGLTTSISCLANEEAWQKAFNAGRAALNHQNLTEAEQAYTTAVNEAKKLGPSNPKLEKSLNNLAAVKSMQGKNADAELLYKQSITIAEKSISTNPQPVVSALNNLAYLYSGEGKYVQALPLLQRAYDIGSSRLAKDNEVALTTLQQLAVLSGKFEKAEPLYNEVLAHTEKNLGSDHPSVRQSKGVAYLSATGLQKDAYNLSKQGKYKEAESLFKRVLAANEKRYGSNDYHLVIDLENLASTYRKQAKYTDAEMLYKRSIELYQAKWGPIATIEQQRNLASLYEEQKKFPEAEATYRLCIKIDEGLGPSKNSALSRDSSSLAILLASQGKFGPAEELFKQALRLSKGLVGKPNGVTQKDMVVYLGGYEKLLRATNRATQANEIAAQIKMLRSTK